MKTWLGEYPEAVIADAGYGSEENYAYLKQHNITPYVKYNTFHDEHRQRRQKKPRYQLKDFTYLPEQDQYVCPEGKSLSYLLTKNTTTENGYVSTRRVYECCECNACPVRSACTRSKYNRRLEIGPQLLQLKQEASDHLLSPRGKQMCSKRPIEVEPVFGRLKQDWGFRRFLLRGLEKVGTEWGILCIAHNIAKAAVQ